MPFKKKKAKQKSSITITTNLIERGSDIQIVCELRHRIVTYYNKTMSLGCDTLSDFPKFSQ